MSQHAGEIYGLPPSRPEDYDAMRLEAIRQRWDRKAQHWDEDLEDEHCHLHEDDAYRRFLAATDAVVAARAVFCRSQLLVDLACGTGLVLKHFIDRFAAGLGLDLSPQMLARAAEKQLPRTRWLAADGFALAAHVVHVGAVFSRGILLSHYGPRQAPVLLEQIRQSLRPSGGFAMLDFLNAATRQQYPSNPDNKTYYHAEQVQHLAVQAGFRCTSILGEPQRRILLLLAEM